MYLIRLIISNLIAAINIEGYQGEILSRPTNYCVNFFENNKKNCFDIRLMLALCKFCAFHTDILIRFPFKPSLANYMTLVARAYSRK